MLEQAVWADVCHLLADPQRVEREYEHRLSDQPESPNSPSAAQLETQIKRLKRATARILDAYEDGWMDKDEFERRIQRTRDRQDRLQAQADALADERLSGASCDW
jgi:site-specific DNA recombinase